jgi:hydrogenase nickel incorporation protein HypA/HybF
MHELSIVEGIVTAVTESLANRPVSRVYTVRLQVGALSGVVEDALQFSYQIATRGTILEGSILDVDHIPVVIHCDICGGDFELPGVQSFRCPACDTPSLQIRRGRELEILSLEVEEDEIEEGNDHQNRRTAPGRAEEE